MKNLKISFLLFLTLLALSCQKEEFGNDETQDALLKVEYLPEKFTIPQSASEISSQAETFIVHTSEPNTSDCSSTEVIWNDMTTQHFGMGLNSIGDINYFGGYFTVTNGEAMLIKVTNNENSLILYERTFDSNEKFFWGFSTDARVQINATTLPEEGSFYIQNAVIGACDFISDSDGDGCLDDADSIINSNMEASIVLNGCNSMVNNEETSACGVMMSDQVDLLEVGRYRNRGGFIKEVAQLTETWVAQGLITQEDKDAIMNCAGSSSI